MFRVLLVALILGGAISGGIWYVNQRPEDLPVWARMGKSERPKEEDKQPDDPAEDDAQKPDQINVVIQAADPFKGSRVRQDEDSFVVTNCQVNHSQEVEVSSQAEGKLAVLGVEVKPGELVRPDDVMTVELPHLEIQANAEDLRSRLPVVQDPKDPNLFWRRWRKGIDPILPKKMRVQVQTKRYRKLRKEDFIHKDQLIGII